jgi:putative transcriptional regulator
MKSLAGHLLIASPGLRDPAFSRSVLLMLEHTEAGAVGVVLNQPIKTKVSALSGKVFEEGFAWDKPLHLGGPVPGSLTVLHTLGDLADREILPGVYNTADAEKVQELIRRRREPSLILANSAAWGPGRLEGECEGGSWLTLPARVGHVFRDGGADLWEEAVTEANARKLAGLLGLRVVPGDPSSN